MYNQILRYVSMLYLYVFYVLISQILQYVIWQYFDVLTSCVIDS